MFLIRVELQQHELFLLAGVKMFLHSAAEGVSELKPMNVCRRQATLDVSHSQTMKYP